MRAGSCAVIVAVLTFIGATEYDQRRAVAQDEIAAPPVALVAPEVAGADAPAIIITKSGYYILSIDDAGVPVPVKVTQVIDYSGGSNPLPPPGGGGGGGGTGDTITPQVRQWTSTVGNPTAARALAVVYRTFVPQIRSGAIPWDRAMEAVKLATDQTLPLVGGAEPWVTWRQNVGGLLNTMIQTGAIKDGPTLASALERIADGLDSSAQREGAAALPDWLMEAIVKLIMALIERFLGGGVTVPPSSPLPI